MSFSDRFSSAVADTYDQAASSTPSSQVKDSALSRKTEDVAAAISNASDDNPVVGLLDMLVMTTLMTKSAEAPWFKEMFDGSSAKIAAAYQQQEREIWRIASQYLSAAQLAELREAIDRWLRDHPDQRHVAMVRLADFSRAKPDQASNNIKTGSVFGLLFLDPLSNLDPAVREVERSRETAQRMFFYFQRMPALIAWQAELSARRSLGAPQVTSLIGDVSRFADSTAKFTETANQVAESLKSFPKTMSEERQRALEQAAQMMAEQRDASIRQASAAVAVERDAAIKHLAAAVAAERQSAFAEATTRASTERDAALQHIGSVLQAERAGLIKDVDAATKSLIDRVIWGEVFVVLMSAAIVVVAALVYRRLRPN